MKRTAATALACMVLLGHGDTAIAQREVIPPKPTVPEVFTLMGKFIRVAYNNQGFVALGYQTAQRSIGEEWLLLEVGLTMRSPAKDFRLKRENLTLKTPDGSTIALATQSDFAKAGYLPALNKRASVQRDSINYFPVEVTRACTLQFFDVLGGRGRQLVRDDVDLTSTRGCVGRIFFHVPGGIKVGQHWLNVNFGESEVQVPFRILTKEEEKEFAETWQDLKKAHDSSYKQ